MYYLKREVTNSVSEHFVYRHGCLQGAQCTVLYMEHTTACFWVEDVEGKRDEPEIIDPVFSQNARFLLSENERFGLVFAKTGSINSGNGEGDKGAP
jgi:hypothetical protein